MNLLTPRWFEIPIKAKEHAIQKKLTQDLLNEKYYHYTVVAGRRSFKTERFGKRMLVLKALQKENGKFFAGAPVRKQAKEIFWKDIKLLIPKYMIEKISESDLKIMLRNGSEINIVGLLEFATVEGGFANGFIISEWQKCEPEVYNQSIEPMINDVNGFVIKEGRPLGKNHLYEDYLSGVEFKKGYASYFWTSEDILNEYQIDRAKTGLGKIDYEREYLASFETGGNPVYYSYNHLNHSDYIASSNKPLIITCDFNATEKPMSWVIGQRIIVGSQDYTYWIKSLSYVNTNTETMCSILEDYLKENNLMSEHLIFYGDYAGKQQKSNSSYSDWQIIENYFRNKCKIFEKKIKFCKSIRDSVASTNAQLCNTNNERKQFVNETNCKALIQDWLKCEWKENSRELKDNDNARGHCCRAVDYYNDYEHSVKGNIQTTFRNLN